ncbi:hypothetical protein HPC49_01690 [Pyxidicoccus fallax]|uniref:Lipoprotein n=1 Tax=Pyxidicoccus fallax TaxID=394095 RepID=A0A848LGU7_9BACT|nr:hypothetical protein [Pyxidicoccus fallax]NMO16021.1 hypothetical protein [Pyxidicoccus fallax]NPC76966.1 hypothetical protein [Pyxidicoccus fallax]
MKDGRKWGAVMLGVALAGGGFAAEASEPAPPDCDFRLECQLGTHAFSVSFDSASGECPEDDMRVFVETPTGAKSELPMEPDWYGSISNLANGESICRVAGTTTPNSGVSAFAVDARRALVFFMKDDRPGYEHVGVALIDAATGKVLDVKQSLGQTKDNPVAVLKTPRGYKLRVVREYLREVRCDCSAAFADDWMAVEVVDGKIRARWMK